MWAGGQALILEVQGEAFCIHLGFENITLKFRGVNCQELVVVTADTVYLSSLMIDLPYLLCSRLESSA